MENASDIRIQLFKIKKEIESKDISAERKNLLKQQLEKLITMESIEYHREIIEKMCEEGYPESKVWEHCQAEIELIDFSLNETNELKKRATSINSSFIDNDNKRSLKREIKKLNSHLNELSSLKRALKHYQVQYCKDYPKSPNSDGGADQNKSTSESKTKVSGEKKKGGRPLSENADQERIISLVSELIKAKSRYCKITNKKKEFINSQGKPKPTPLRDYLVANYPEVSGVGDRQMFERVRMAISELCSN